MAQISVFVILSLVVTVFYIIGVVKFLTDVKVDKCEMTYMYEYPQFIRVANKIDNKYKKYGLYAYGEGRLTSRVRNMNFDGIPVLFIPGNAGSCKQVRSLSSVALRKSLSANTVFHFDYFTVDLNDEYSGLYGPLLFDQLDYVNHSFYRIFELYKESRKPQSIVLIGHSMGGVIAKKLLSQLSERQMVPILITLASPLKRAPLILDRHLESFYDSSSIDTFPYTNLINLFGGYRDFLIPSALSNIKNELHLNLVTSNVPMTWFENNHVQILWCKQLILAITRALFDSVDTKTNFISTNYTYREMVFHHHLNHHSGIKIRNLPQYNELIKLDFKGKWIESLLKQYTVEHMKGVKEPHWYMVKLTLVPGYEILNVLALNLEIVNWVYTCNAYYLKGPSRVCPEAYQLTHVSEIVPSVKYKRRFIQINLPDVYWNNTELTHIVFRTLPTNEPIVFHVDIHSDTDRHIQVELPKWWSTKKHVIIQRTAEKMLNLKMSLLGFHHVIQYYELYVEPLQCSRDNHHASVSLIIPWAKENRHAFFTSVEKTPFDLRLISSKPNNISDVPYLRFILDPSCNYEISIKFSLVGLFGQLARFYTPFLLTNVAVVVLLALNYQLMSLKKGYWPIIFTALSGGSRAYYFILVFSMLLVESLKFLPTSSIAKPDMLYIIDDGLNFTLLPVVLYLHSVGIVWFLSIMYGISLFTLESTANKVALKLLTRTFVWSNYFMIFLHKVPAVVAVILVFLSVTTCGSLALCMGNIFYFMRLTQMSQDYVEDVGWSVVKKVVSRFLNFFLRKRKPQQEITHINNTNKQESITSATDDVNIHQDVSEESANLEQDKDNHEKVHFKDDKKIEQILNKDDVITELDTQVFGHCSEDNIVSSADSSEQENQHADISKGNALSADYNAIFFHSTIFFLWCIISLINLPAVLTWAHNFKFYKSLTPDDSFVPGVALSLCAFPLWHLEFPRNKKVGLNILNFIINVVIGLCIVFATVSLYRLSYLLTFVIVIVTLHQIFAPQEVVSEEDNSKKQNPKDDLKDKYDEIKKKLD